MKGILGQKLGMTSVFGEFGSQIPVTALYIGGNIIVGKRTEERDGYSAVILGFGEQKVKRINKPEQGFLRKQNIIDDESENTVRHLREFRVTSEELDSFTVGDSIQASSLFNVGEKVDVSGTSKGRGFTGVMVRHNFSGTKATHGVHEVYRHGGSIGMATYPARVFKNKKMPGQHGNKRVTMQNLMVAGLVDEDNIILIRGNVPGPNGGVLEIKQGVKVRRY
jgi:large subunit ribosomal protein L3